MGTIFSYLMWRGDLTFRERSFCEVDNLILAMLSYADLAGSVPEWGNEEFVSVKDAWTAYQKLEHSSDSTAQQAGAVLEAMAHSRRFQNAILSNFRCVYVPEHTQFAAVTIHLDDGTSYVSYRGTDETIVGWREDFCIGFERTPAQEMAADYLAHTLIKNGTFRIGGHSKGGNLAEYAALCCPDTLQDCILEIWCNDSPGLCREVLPETDFHCIEKKTIRILPEYSIIGTLFLQTKPDAIVASSASGILQHDAYTWQVEGDRFSRCLELSPDSILLVDTLNQWINSADMEHRRAFTRDFFDALEANGAKTMPEVAHGGIDSFGTVLLSLATSESRTKLVVLKFLRSFLANCKKNNIRQVIGEKALYRNMSVFLLGLVCMTAPSAALQFVGTAAGGVIFCWSLYKLYRLVVCGTEDVSLRKKHFVLYILQLCGAGFYIMNQKTVQISTSLIMAACLFVCAFQKIKASADGHISRARRIFFLFTATLSTMLGVVSIVLAGKNTSMFILALGTFILLYGAVGIVNVLFQSGKKEFM